MAGSFRGVRWSAHSRAERCAGGTGQSGLASNEAGFRIDARLSGGAFTMLGTVPTNSRGALVLGLAPGVKYDFRVASFSGGSQSGFSNIASAYTDSETTPSGSCTPGTGVCLDDRFRVSATWRTSTESGNAVPQKLSNLSSAFSFFQPDNLEVLLKVLDGCGINGAFWVFFSATTNVEMTVTVADTQAGIIRRYFNPLNHAATPVQDTSALATCP